MSEIPAITPLSEYDTRVVLNQKSQETLEWLILSHSQGKLTDRDLYVGLQTLWMSVAGLVDKQLMETITEAQRLAPSGRCAEIRDVKIATKEGQFRILIRGKNGTEVGVIAPGPTGSLRGMGAVKYEDQAEGLHKFNRLIDSLERSGYQVF